MLKNFLQTKEYLYSLIPTSKKRPFPGQRGLLRMRCLLQRLGNPEKKFPSVHIVGTSGKSSTAYLTAKIMQEAGPPASRYRSRRLWAGEALRAGYKVGLTISPHLQTIRERMQINGQLIPQSKFIEFCNKIRPVAEDMRQAGFGCPSYFEVLLAAAFLYFAKEKVDLAVIEAGLGGRFDGTNVLEPEIVVLTNIGLDHTEILGKTKAAILRDKMQVIKPGCQCVITGVQQKGLLAILKKHCQKQNVPLLIHRRDFFASEQNISPTHSYFTFNYNCADSRTDPSSAKFALDGSVRRARRIKLGLPGTFQIENACLAIAAARQLFINKGLTPGVKAVKKALAEAFFPGRLELVKKRPLIILDGAHNEDKIKALIKSIKILYLKKEIILVFGVKKDKNVAKMLTALNKISNRFIITQFGKETDLGFKLHYPAKKLFLATKQLLPQAELLLEPKPEKALKKARELASPQDLILITGSLYLIGEVRQFLKETYP